LQSKFIRLGYKKFAADYLFTGKEMHYNGEVLITDEQGIVKEIVAKENAGDDVYFVNGIICPGFINCHCHLELSHLKGAIDTHTGLVSFILAILKLRHSSETEMIAAMLAAQEAMINSGIVAVGDISNNAMSLPTKLKSKLYYHNFIEVSGFSPAIAQQRFDVAKDVYHQFIEHYPNQTSIVPHAPYSVSEQLFKLIDNFGHSAISSIHNQEAFDENEFFLKGVGQFTHLYQQLGVDTQPFFKPTNKNSLHSIAGFIQTPKKILFVHNTFTSSLDIDYLNATHPNQEKIFCLCINANLYIENKLPPINLLMDNHCTLVLGTDSLASNEQLSIVAEMQTISQHFPLIPTATLLQWATANGAKALGIQDRFGSFEKGMQPGIININHLSADGTITKTSHSTVLMGGSTW